MNTPQKLVKRSLRSLPVAGLSLILMLGTPLAVQADVADAKRMLKEMSEYMAAQKTLSFSYDATLEVVTMDDQKLALVSSGTVNLERPNKIFTTRTGGLADVEMSFDGKTMTLLGRNQNIYTQVKAPGTVDQLVDELRFKYNRPLPAADLLLADSYEALTFDVTDVKDLGSGVVGGVECDHLAFRAKEVDWQIWIAQGEHPYPCRYSITSKLISGGPQYTIQTRNWKTGDKVSAADFSFKNATKASKVELTDLKGTDDLPEHYKLGGSK